MTDDADDVEYVALEMIGRFGAEAAQVARELARSAEEQQRASAQTWRGIADAIERSHAGEAMQREGVEDAE
jgi:hypothetical protein